MPKAWRFRFLAAALLLAAGACGEEADDSAAQESAYTVEAFDNYFEPTSLQLEPGAEATVSLQNSGSVAHSFTVPDIDIEIEAQGGETVASTFSVPDRPGSLDFYCKFHPEDMTGTIAIGGVGDPIEEDVDRDDDDDDVDVDADVNVEEEDQDTNY